MTPASAADPAAPRLPRGVIVELVTPFLPDGQLDLPGLQRLVEWLLTQGVDGLAVCCATGESSALSAEEKSRIVATAVAQSAGRVPVMAGVQASSRAEALQLAKATSAAGADVLLGTLPAGGGDGLQEACDHFSALADAAEQPVVLDLRPAPGAPRCALGAVLQLAAHPSIVGVHDDADDPGYLLQVARHAGGALALYGGHALAVRCHLEVGVRGVISPVAQVAARTLRQLCLAMEQRDAERVGQLSQELRFLDDVFASGQPAAALKCALSLLGILSPAVRPPLAALDGQERKRVEAVLQHLGLRRKAEWSYLH